MIDFDDFEEQELQAGDVLQPEGEVEPLPDLPGFEPAGHAGGCGSGGKLRLLCFHGSQSNAVLMARQMNVLFATHTGAQSTWLEALAEWECLDGPLTPAPPERGGGELLLQGDEAPLQEEDAQKQRRAVEEALGARRAWYEKVARGSPKEAWQGLGEALELAMEELEKRAPLDGLLGFGQGGELVCQLARMAEEGHPRLRGRFKFVVTKAARWPKAAPELRPRRPLRVPALHLCELRHGIYPSPDFEDLAVHWEPGCREVLWLEREKAAAQHKPGLPPAKPKPPRLLGAQLARARAFLAAFQAGEAWAPSANEDPYIAGRVLPLPRCREAELAQPSPSKPLQLLCFHDTDGTPGGGELNSRIWEAVRRSALHTPLSSCLEIEAPNLVRLMTDPRDLLGDVAGSPAPPWYHAVSEQTAELADKLVEAVLRESRLEPRPIAFAGIGLGAFLALRCAAAFRARGGLAWRLYAIKPPASFPAPGEGLGATGVRCLLEPWDAQGERWRLQAATKGPVAVKVLEHAVHCDVGTPLAYDTTGGDPTEGSLPWAEALVEDLLQAFAWN